MFHVLRTTPLLILTLMLRLTSVVVSRSQARGHDERGEAVPWLIVLGAGIGIAYFAGDAVMAFATNLVGKLGE